MNYVRLKTLIRMFEGWLSNSITLCQIIVSTILGSSIPSNYLFCHYALLSIDVGAGGMALTKSQNRWST